MIPGEIVLFVNMRDVDDQIGFLLLSCHILGGVWFSNLFLIARIL